jgi:hypothetical protein
MINVVVAGNRGVPHNFGDPPLTPPTSCASV